MDDSALKHILIYGGGIAAWMSAAALTSSLPASIKITVIETSDTDFDAFYGSVSSPSLYDFNLNVGINEPNLLFNSNTSFSWGTHFKNWGMDKFDWVQCHHQALPVLELSLIHI